MADSNITGPIYISIGQSDKIDLFLENNPGVRRDMIFVDDYDLGAYKAVGLHVIGLESSKLITEKRSMKMPKFGLSRWKDYITSVNDLTPKNNYKEGVLMNGGTFAVNGNEVLYAYNDAVPGDHPEPAEVIKILLSSNK